MRWTWLTLDRRIDLEQLIARLNQRMKFLENVLQFRGAGVASSFADGDTTPSVAEASVFTTANAAPTSITAFDDGVPAQRFHLIFGDANTTLVHGANLQLIGDANFVGAVGDVKHFVTEDGVVWREVPQPTVWA